MAEESFVSPLASPVVKTLTVREPYATAIALGVKPWETRTGPPTGPTRPPGVRGEPGHSLDVGERVLIAASSRPPLAGRYGPLHVERVRVGRSFEYLCTLDIEHGPYPDDSCAAAGHAPLDHVVTLRPGHLVGSVEYSGAIPILTPDQAVATTPEECVVVKPDGALRWHITERSGRWTSRTSTDMTDQLSLGIWTPLRWAWKLTDPLPLGAGCPLCGVKPGDALVREVFDASDPEAVLEPCRVCGGDGTDGPVPVKGKLGVWAL